MPLLVTPFGDRVAKAIESDYGGGKMSTYVKLHAGENPETCAWVAARYMEEHGIYGKVGVKATRKCRCIEIIYGRG